MRAPLHPLFVHFSIALTGASAGFDLAGLLLDQPSLSATGWWTLAASAAITFATVATGIVSRLGLPVAEGRARSYLRAHMGLGPIFLGALLAMSLWRADAWSRVEPVSWPYLAGIAALVLVMGVQGYLGGEMVYRFGMNVDRRYRPLPIEQSGAPPASRSNPPSESP